MDPRLTQRERSHLSAATFRDAEEREAIRLAAIAARDAAFAEGLRRAGRSLVAALTTLARAVTEWPSKRSTYTELLRLSDRELADIGLSRADISRVFEPDFVRPLPAAKAPKALPSQRPLAA